jgi:16S rRNA (uracil1498-N3)-methyltransferase
MAVDPPREWRTFQSLGDLPATRFLLHTAKGLPELAAVKSAAVVAIGPEGGFTNAEIDSANTAGWQVVSLGNRVLRLETAAIAAVARLST